LDVPGNPNYFSGTIPSCTGPLVVFISDGGSFETSVSLETHLLVWLFKYYKDLTNQSYLTV